MMTIGIDLGTTTISLVVFDTERKTVTETRTLANDSFLATENEWERIQDAERIVRLAQTELDALLKCYPEVSAIGLTGQMHGILYLDAHGKSLSPLFTWQDQRGNLWEFAADDRGMRETGSNRLKTDMLSERPADIRKDSVGEGPDARQEKPADAGDGTVSEGSAGERPAGAYLTAAEWIREACGVEVSTGYGLVTHFYQCRKGLAPEDAASVCTIPDYLGMVLTGRNRPLLHTSMAASLGFFDVQRGEFLRDVLQNTGADASVLPEVTDQLEVLGTYRGRPVTTAIGDNQAGFLGAVGTEQDVLLVNIGTGSQISVLSDRYFASPGIEARPFPGSKYLLAGSSLCGGRAYAILEKFFRSYASAAGAGDEPQYEVMGALAEKALRRRVCSEENGQRLRVVTAFQGTRTDPDARGSIANINEDNLMPGNLILGVLEGMAHELYEMYSAIRANAGIEVKRIVASGNGVRRNAVLRQVLAETFRAEVKLADCEEEAACGAARSCCLRSRR